MRDEGARTGEQGEPTADMIKYRSANPNCTAVPDSQEQERGPARREPARGHEDGDPGADVRVGDGDEVEEPDGLLRGGEGRGRAFGVAA